MIRHRSPPDVPPGQLTVVLALATAVLADRTLRPDPRMALYMYTGVIAGATAAAIFLDLILPYRRSRRRR